MISTKKITLVLLPAILLASLAFFIRFIQYQPTNLDNNTDSLNKNWIEMQIPIYPEDPIIGDKKNPKTIILFGDFGCEACKIQSEILEQIQNKYPKKIKIIWKGLAVIQFPEPTNMAHEYAFCINQQKKFLDFYKITLNKDQKLTTSNLQIIVDNLKIDQNKLDKCLQSVELDNYIEKNKALSLALNIQAVPTIFLENKQITIPTNLNDWLSILEL